MTICKMITHRSNLQLILRINGPLRPSYQLEQGHLHLQKRVSLAKAFPRVGIESDVPASDRLPAGFGHDLFRLISPSLRDEFSRCGAPSGRIAVHAWRVPSDEDTFRNVHFAGQRGVFQGDTVNEL